MLRNNSEERTHRLYMVFRSGSYLVKLRFKSVFDGIMCRSVAGVARDGTVVGFCCKVWLFVRLCKTVRLSVSAEG
jgi:hypothetical protein